MQVSVLYHVISIYYNCATIIYSYKGQLDSWAVNENPDFALQISIFVAT